MGGFDTVYVLRMYVCGMDVRSTYIHTILFLVAYIVSIYVCTYMRSTYVGMYTIMYYCLFPCSLGPGVFDSSTELYIVCCALWWLLVGW